MILMHLQEQHGIARGSLHVTRYTLLAVRCTLHTARSPMGAARHQSTISGAVTG